MSVGLVAVIKIKVSVPSEPLVPRLFDTFFACPLTIKSNSRVLKLHSVYSRAAVFFFDDYDYGLCVCGTSRDAPHAARIYAR